MLITDDVEITIEPGDARTDTEAQEIYRNLQVLFATRTGEQMLDRDYGIDADVLDWPQETAQALLAAEYVRKCQAYEPRARVQEVNWLMIDHKEGYMKPKVVIELV